MSRTLNAIAGGMLVAALIASFAFAAPEPQPSPPQIFMPQGLPWIVPPGAVELPCLVVFHPFVKQAKAHNMTNAKLPVGTTIYYKLGPGGSAPKGSFKLQTSVPSGQWFKLPVQVTGPTDCTAFVKL